ncbi:armadillo repeat-containing 5 [Brachionus plicatilis]|uniref:Armadillo repeat-containing 5 n=1 Tax=Brachionus plicatilis TaxID=10195 RepID=A0A3M7RS47_BRAPC|nr:armadillo repeat-containing 5 [Brachionus plicatilis]
MFKQIIFQSALITSEEARKIEVLSVLLKYASEIENCSKLVIQNRILVFLCIYMYKLNKNLKLSNADKSTKTKENQQSDATTVTDNLSTPIPMNSKHYFLFKDLVKQFLIALDSWPSSSEFYNQIIEGLFIEHLLWIQNKSTNNLNILSKESKSDQKFDYCEFSFNLLYKLCRDYHACRAEFGRIGGISKYVQKIETMTPNLSPNLNKKVVNYSYLKEYTILIDIICLTCKESVNRLRYKDQGLLVNLIKLQHTLKQNKDEINKLYKNDQQTEDISFIDSTLYNKILVALCCFAHDQDSMSILLNNSLVDCLLGYLNEGMELKKRSEEEKMELVESDLDENKIFSLKKLLNLSDETRANSKKRKTLDSAETGQKAKRVNSELSAILSSSPPFLPTFQPSDVPNFENHATSPTESCLSLSPNIYISSSPPYIQSRCSSAQIFQGLSPNYYSSLSPTTSSDLPSSPSYFNLNGDQEIDNERQIKFSPSINDEASCSSACTSENEEIMEEEIDLKKEEAGEDANENISQNIESINHTEACVFYVLSQLSHGDKPSVHLFQNFDSIVTALLKYLKKATVRNPRALRILNRLTKNQYCFPHFVLNHFPLRIKEVFYEAFSKREISLKAKKNLRRSKSLSGNLDTQKTQTIEKEMNVYLNSNKAFFDATSFFPSFQSIEFILINNLKSQCISSSDSGYLSLISLAKQKKPEKLASTLVAPFILRNSKALSYIMIQLNNLDLVFESIFEQKCDQKSKFTSILCIHRILSFINYKRDVKQVKDLYDQARSKINEMLRRSDNSEQSLVIFKFEGNKNIKASRTILLNKSEYFNLLLNGPFLNSDCIELKDVSEESFGILVEILNSRSLNELDSFEERKINFEQCLDMVMTCDRFMLGDLKDLFVTGMVMKFISHGTASNCFKLAWYVNSDFLANATMDFVLSEYCSDSINDEENLGFKKFLEFFDSILASVKEAVDEKSHSDENGSQTLSDYLKKTLKYALSEIIKNNSWKF